MRLRKNPESKIKTHFSKGGYKRRGLRSGTADAG